jgi:hypothetical protein
MRGDSCDIIDPQYLVGCFARFASGFSPAAPLDGEGGDLWRLLLRPFHARWVNAHLSAAQAKVAGVSERDRINNDAADRACLELAAAHPPFARSPRRPGGSTCCCYCGPVRHCKRPLLNTARPAAQSCAGGELVGAMRCAHAATSRGPGPRSCPFSTQLATLSYTR